MAISNGSFEIGTGVIGEAQGWSSICSTAVTIVGFGDTEDPLEIFNWGGFISEITGIPTLFSDGEIYDNFEWGFGVFYSEWYTGWVTSIDENFEWYAFDDTFHNGVVFPYDDFEWDSFNDVWIPGLVAMFNDDSIPGNVPYETFNDSSW